MGKLFDTGINAVIPEQRAIPEELLDPKVKNRSRLHYMMANIQTAEFTGENNWPLLLDPDNFVAEGSGDNFFIVKNNELYTPEPRNILVGISRNYIFELAKKIGIVFHETNLEVKDVENADEAFMTATPFCMLPVTSLHKKNIGNGKRGPIFNKLLKEWSSSVGLDIEKQIKNFNKELENNKISGPSPYQFKTNSDGT